MHVSKCCNILCFQHGIRKGSFQRTSCSRNLRKQPFFFRREAWEVTEVMTELSFEDTEGIAPPHHAGLSAVPKSSGSRALPDPAKAAREVTNALPPSPNSPSPARSPCPNTGCHGAEGTAFHIPSASRWGVGWSFHQAAKCSGRMWTAFPTAMSPPEAMVSGETCHSSYTPPPPPPTPPRL